MKIDHFMPTEAALKELGRRLSLMRSQTNLNQEELASAAGIGVATLRRIESGSDGQISTWLKVLNALGMTSAIDDLLPEEIRSPMAEVKAAKKKSRGKRTAAHTTVWGDEV